jgi:hypothetical protein
VNQTLGFEKIFVINLPFRTDRRDALELMAAATDMKLDFSRAVKGEEVEGVALVYVRSFCTTDHRCLAQNTQGTFEKRSKQWHTRKLEKPPQCYQDVSGGLQSMSVADCPKRC